MKPSSVEPITTSKAPSSTSTSIARKKASTTSEAIARPQVSLGPLEHIAASSFGGTLTAIAVTPLDVVKTRLQAQGPSPGIPSDRFINGTVDGFVKISRNEGMRSLWRGLTPSILMTVPSTAIYFSTYERFRDLAEKKVGWEVAPLLAGAPARVIAVLATSPLELLRTYLQSKQHTSSLSEVLKERFSGHGLRGFKDLWLGFVPTLWRDVPFSMLYWTLIEHTRRRLKDYSLTPFLMNLTSGAIAGAISAFVTCPFDVMKTRAQMHLDAHVVKPSERKMLPIARALYAERGLSSFFKGAVPRSVRVAPAAAIMIASYEQFKLWMLDYKKKHM